MVEQASSSFVEFLSEKAHNIFYLSAFMLQNWEQEKCNKYNKNVKKNVISYDDYGEYSRGKEDGMRREMKKKENGRNRYMLVFPSPCVKEI